MKSLRMLRFGALAAALLAGALPAVADVAIKDGNGNLQTLCTTTFGTPTKHAYCHNLVDANGSAFGILTNPFHTALTIGGADLTSGQKSKAGSIGVALPNDPDILSAAATITAADGASTTATGQNSVSVFSGSATAGSTYSVAVNGQSEADFTISGAFIGTLQFEGSANGGTTWTPRSAHVMGTKYRQTQVTAPGIFHINAAGLTNIRVRAIALTSGTPSVQLNTTAGTGSVYVLNSLELVDNATGLSPTVKQAGTATTSDNGLTVQNPSEQAALGAPADTAYTGSGNTSIVGALKGLFNQAIQALTPGSQHTQMIGVEGSTGMTPVAVTGTITTQSGTALASPAYRLGSAASGNNAQVFATGTKKMLHAYFCNKAAADRVLKFYDTASTPVPGTTAIVTSIVAPAGACPVIDFSSGGFPFSAGVAIAITAAGDSDTGSTVAAGDIVGLNIQHN